MAKKEVDSLEHKGKAIVFIDGVCVLCNHFADFVLAKNVTKRLFLASLQGSVADLVLDPKHTAAPPQSVVLFDNGKVLLRSAAVLRIFYHLGGKYRLLSLLLSLVPLPMSDLLYKVVAKYRYQFFGKRESCRLPTAEEKDVFLS
jgi:predicted DCC family thiol-disulfide oxidoreductase YuxK